MTLQLLPSEFPYIWGKFNFLFYQCVEVQIEVGRIVNCKRNLTFYFGIDFLLYVQIWGCLVPYCIRWCFSIRRSLPETSLLFILIPYYKECGVNRTVIHVWWGPFDAMRSAFNPMCDRLVHAWCAPWVMRSIRLGLLGLFCTRIILRKRKSFFSPYMA